MSKALTSRAGSRPPAATATRHRGSRRCRRARRARARSPRSSELPLLLHDRERPPGAARTVAAHGRRPTRGAGAAPTCDPGERACRRPSRRDRRPSRCAPTAPRRPSDGHLDAGGQLGDRCRPTASGSRVDRDPAGGDVARSRPRGPVGSTAACRSRSHPPEDGTGSTRSATRRATVGVAQFSWTSSISVPNAVFGCTNATVVPRLPGTGRLVDDPVTLRLHPLERHRAVGDPVADVVEALALLLQVLRDRRVVPRSA